MTDGITGSKGEVVSDEGGSTVQVAWEPNSHGGYINDHPREVTNPAN